MFDEPTNESIHWHDYRKTPRSGRKIGHVTVTANTQAGLQARAALLAAELGVAAELDLEMVLQAVDLQAE